MHISFKSLFFFQELTLSVCIAAAVDIIILVILMPALGLRKIFISILFNKVHKRKKNKLSCV